MDVSIPPATPAARVLVVDDDPMLADLIAEWVREKWECETANGGDSALSALGDDGFDVVLLDREMPGTAGEAVLAAIRTRELPIRVMMVSAIEPDFDLIELPIDDYLQKPVDRPAVQGKIEGLLLRSTYHSTVERFFVCAAKLSVLESTKSAAELAEEARYVGLKARADELRQAADATLGQRSDLVAGLTDYTADD